jgi:hypothetical protein
MRMAIFIIGRRGPLSEGERIMSSSNKKKEKNTIKYKSKKEPSKDEPCTTIIGKHETLMTFFNAIYKVRTINKGEQILHAPATASGWYSLIEDENGDLHYRKVAPMIEAD